MARIPVPTVSWQSPTALTLQVRASRNARTPAPRIKRHLEYNVAASTVTAKSQYKEQLNDCQAKLCHSGIHLAQCPQPHLTCCPICGDHLHEPTRSLLAATTNLILLKAVLTESDRCAVLAAGPGASKSDDGVEVDSNQCSAGVLLSHLLP